MKRKKSENSYISAKWWKTHYYNLESANQLVAQDSKRKCSLTAMNFNNNLFTGAVCVVRGVHVFWRRGCKGRRSTVLPTLALRTTGNTEKLLKCNKVKQIEVNICVETGTAAVHCVTLHVSLNRNSQPSCVFHTLAASSLGSISVVHNVAFAG